MTTMPPTPTPERVRAACDEFEQKYRVVEGALGWLFAQYPSNDDLRHVLLKVVALSSLYGTRIFAYSEKIPNLVDVALHIRNSAAEIGSALSVGAPEVVERISRVSVAKKADRNFFSFATKFCSWHKPDLYPIWDANVQRYLRRLQRHSDFAGSFKINAEHWEYREFRDAMVAFRDFYGISSFNFKDIDKFLWLYGEAERSPD